MYSTFDSNLQLSEENWKVKKIAVIGPGIVGMPMAALLANAKIKIGTDSPAKVVVIQRNSKSSGWKVDAINSGKSTIGGIEPELDEIVSDTVKQGLLTASHDYAELSDADVILVCVQTDRKDFAPDYDPLFESLTNAAHALQFKPADKIPLIIFESTLAPSSMQTLIKEHFRDFGLEEGRDVLLGNSPNRVMPGRLVERVVTSDKIVAGLNPITPRLIKKLYSHIVTKGNLYPTNSFTAEIVKTLENAYRDVRIAYSAEVVQYCDKNDIDFYDLREKVNELLAQKDSASKNPNDVPKGGLLIPTIGVGGHCLPKDGILLWWRKIESDADTSQSIILNSRLINDKSPAAALALLENNFGDISNKKICLLGAAYRFNSEDTRNSPTFQLAKILLGKNCTIKIHDPYVKVTDQNLLKFNLDKYFTNNLEDALENSDVIIFCTAHKIYLDKIEKIKNLIHQKNIFDGCNLFNKDFFVNEKINYAGIGKGKKVPREELINLVYSGFRSIETGFANEIKYLVDFFNSEYVQNNFNKVKFSEVQRLAKTCSTGCELADYGSVNLREFENDFVSILIDCAENKKTAYPMFT